jgi:hypothetical protein
MNLQNGYKVIYEKAAEGKRTFYAAKTGVCDPAVDTELASFVDADYQGKVIYEHKGKVYISNGTVPAYDENGEPSDECVAAFDEVLAESSSEGDDEAEEEEPSIFAEAITTNGDSHGKLTVAGNVVTLNATGTIEQATNQNGTTYHHVGFKVTAPDGIDPANIIITRPDGKTRVMANILDGDNFTNMYWKITEEDRVFTYYIDWNNDGVNDLTVVIDATAATLVAEAVAE